MKLLATSLFSILSILLSAQSYTSLIEVEVENNQGLEIPFQIQVFGDSATTTSTFSTDASGAAIIQLETDFELESGFGLLVNCNDLNILELLDVSSDPDFDYALSFDYCDPDQILGCTDSTATNFNPAATIDDGSCVYSECDGTEMHFITDNGSMASGYYSIENTDGTVFLDGALENGFTIYEECLNDGCYTLNFSDVELSGPIGNGFFTLWVGENIGVNDYILAGDTAFNFIVGSGCDEWLVGCTDPAAINYNPDAVFDDGSCEYPPAPNDLCEDAIFIEPGEYTIDNTQASQNEDIWGECWNFGSGEGEQSSVWYTFTTPENPAAIDIEVVGDGTNSLTDTQFGLFEECGGEMIQCDGNSGQGLLSAFHFGCGDLEPSTDYILMIDGWNGDAGTATLSYSVDANCDEEVYGCTDPEAVNYNPLATTDDGSCTYADSCEYLLAMANIACDEKLFYLYDPYNQSGVEYTGTWTVNGVDVSTSSDTLHHIFTEPGEYNVCLSGFVAGCSEMVEECVDVYVYSGCFETPCLELTYTTQDSCTFNFSLINNSSDSLTNLIWYPPFSSDGVESGFEYTHTFDNSGIYEVCVQFDGSGCAGEACVTVVTESCQTEIYGCTDPEALNYNPNATVNDNSCEYECTDVQLGFDYFNGTPDDSSYIFMNWTITNYNNEVVESGDWYNWAPQYDLCLTNGCYTFTLNNVSPIWNGIYYIHTDSEELASGVFSGENETLQFNFGVNESGCTDSTFVYGCTDPEALNYNPLATIDDGSCTYADSCDFVIEPYFITCSSYEFFLSDLDISSTGTWLIDGAVVSENNSAIYHEFTEPGTYNVCFIADAMNCDDVETCTVIYVDPSCFSTSPQIISSTADSCTYSFSIIPNGNSLSNFVWYPGDGTAYDGGTEFTYTYQTSGFYNACVAYDGPNGTEELCVDLYAESCEMNIYGCTDSTAVNYNPEANVDDGSCVYEFDCNVGFTIFPDSLGANTIWIIPTFEVENIVDILWDFGDGTTSTEVFPNHEYADEGPYTLCVTASLQSDGTTCDATFCAEISGDMIGSGLLSSGFNINVIEGSDPLSVTDNMKPRDFQLFPNPAQEVITLQYNTNGSSIEVIEIFDVTGKRVDMMQFNVNSGENIKFIDIEHLPNGLYVLSLSNINFKRFVKSD